MKIMRTTTSVLYIMHTVTAASDLHSTLKTYFIKYKRSKIMRTTASVPRNTL